MTTTNGIAPATGKTSPAPPALIVLGLDDAKKSHASWFGESETDQARSAAQVMGMAALPVANEELKILANGLPHGRLFASGKAFVPFVKRTTYQQLLGHLTDAERTRLAAERDQQKAIMGSARTPAADWDSIKLGSLVVGWESEDDGWWVAIVMKVNDINSFTLKWLDYPEMPLVIRQRKHIALLHPDFEAR